MIKQISAKFFIGQIIRHKLFDYRGVVVNVDSTFQGSQEWYEQVARSRPPKDQPWYQVLVHDGQETYVAQRNLTEDESKEPINHPYVDELFDQFEGGIYRSSAKAN
jgi:heat shock protein HspQ